MPVRRLAAPKKKKTSPSISRPQTGAWWGGPPFAYTAEQKKAMLSALPLNPHGAAIIDTIEQRAREYLGEREYRNNDPLPRAIATQLQEGAAWVETGQRWLRGLHDQTIEALDEPVAASVYHTTRPDPAGDMDTIRKTLDPILGALRERLALAQRTHTTKRGAPDRTAALRAFLGRLLDLWEESGNHLPRREFDDRYGNPPLRLFLNAVLFPLGIKTYAHPLRLILLRKHEARASAVSPPRIPQRRGHAGARRTR